jgi:hypothetical protein
MSKSFAEFIGPASACIRSYDTPVVSEEGKAHEQKLRALH